MAQTTQQQRALQRVRARQVKPLFDVLERRFVKLTALAREVGIPEPSIYSIRRGAMLPPPGFVERVCLLQDLDPERYGVETRKSA